MVARTCGRGRNVVDYFQTVPVNAGEGAGIIPMLCIGQDVKKCETVARQKGLGGLLYVS